MRFVSQIIRKHLWRPSLWVLKTAMIYLPVHKPRYRITALYYDNSARIRWITEIDIGQPIRVIRFTVVLTNNSFHTCHLPGLRIVGGLWRFTQQWTVVEGIKRVNKMTRGLNRRSAGDFGGEWEFAVARLITAPGLTGPYMDLRHCKSQIHGCFCSSRVVDPSGYGICSFHHTMTWSM